MKQEVQIVDLHREENSVDEDLRLAEEAKEEKFGVIHVENGDMNHRNILIIK